MGQRLVLRWWAAAAAAAAASTTADASLPIIQLGDDVDREFDQGLKGLKEATRMHQVGRVCHVVRLRHTHLHQGHHVIHGVDHQLELVCEVWHLPGENRPHSRLEPTDGRGSLREKDVRVRVRNAPNSRHVRRDCHGDLETTSTETLLSQLEGVVRVDGTV